MSKTEKAKVYLQISTPLHLATVSLPIKKTVRKSWDRFHRYGWVNLSLSRCTLVNLEYQLSASELCQSRC